ncbi:MAG TPA: hypothetical protein VMV43_06865 [Candidatus Nanopelagicaceae bacterium]|nr:hypothetical protein [Candidatus Nanopelagicaceae bacterium]
MFNLEEFEKDTVIYSLVEKLNKLLDKNKTEKVKLIVGQLNNLLEQQEHEIQITYILSILAEQDSTLIGKEILKNIENLTHSDNSKTKVNAIIIIGFVMLSSKNDIVTYLPHFMENLNDDDRDARDNIHYFLHEVATEHSDLICNYKSDLIDALSVEDNEENLVALIQLLNRCLDYSFENLYDLRKIIISLINRFYSREQTKTYSELLSFVKNVFPSLNDLIIEELDKKELINEIQNTFIMKRYVFLMHSAEIEGKTKDFLQNLKSLSRNDLKIYFYVKTQEKKIHIYELEKEKLESLFLKKENLQKKQLLKIFAHIIDTEQELRLFLNTLIKLENIRGYYSKLGYFYTYNNIESELIGNFQEKGMVNLKKYNHLPPDFINGIIKDISNSTNQVFLLGKSDSAYFSLKKIQQQINTEAAKNTSIDLKTYRELLSERDFIKLIKNLPKGYLTNFRKGTQWLTNVGLSKIKKEIENSKLIGYYSIPKLSEKYKIRKALLVEILEQFVDIRSGIYDNNKETFYFSKFLNQRIDKINSIPSERDKQREINLLVDEFNIEKNHILTKLDENLKLIGKEILGKELISINEYTEKTGMTYEVFLEFINSLGLNYFKKRELLIFNEAKIEDSKNDIKLMLIDKSKSENVIYLGDIDVTSNIVEDLLKELRNNEKIKGIFHIQEGELVFYTEKGIENLMIENSFLFSFSDFFYGKILDDKDIEVLTSVFNNLISKNLLKGTFDNDSLTFASSDVIFAQDYNIILFEFEKMITKYIKTFNIEFEKIKKILTKRNETIFPQEIKMIQERIDIINEKYIHWRNGLEAFVSKASSTLLQKQGFTLKKYKSMSFSTENKEEIKFFEEDPEVIDLISNFDRWVKLFNELELKYGNIIFYQKRLIIKEDNKEDREKLEDLLSKLHLV